MRPVAGLDIVVSHHADRPVRLEDAEHHVLDVRDAVLAQGLPQLVVRDPGPQSVLLEDLAVVAFAMMRSSTRSKVDIWPSWRVPVRRNPTSRAR